MLACRRVLSRVLDNRVHRFYAPTIIYVNNNHNDGVRARVRVAHIFPRRVKIMIDVFNYASGAQKYITSALRF